MFVEAVADAVIEGKSEFEGPGAADEFVEVTATEEASAEEAASSEPAPEATTEELAAEEAPKAE